MTNVSRSQATPLTSVTADRKVFVPCENTCAKVVVYEDDITR